MISKEVLLTILNYIANGVVTVESSTTQAITTLAPSNNCDNEKQQRYSIKDNNNINKRN